MIRLCNRCLVKSHTQDSGATQVKQRAHPRWGRVIVLVRHWETRVTRHNVLVILYLKTVICHQTQLMTIKALASSCLLCPDARTQVCLVQYPGLHAAEADDLQTGTQFG